MKYSEKFQRFLDETKTYNMSIKSVTECRPVVRELIISRFMNSNIIKYEYVKKNNSIIRYDYDEYCKEYDITIENHICLYYIYSDIMKDNFENKFDWKNSNFENRLKIMMLNGIVEIDEILKMSLNETFTYLYLF